MEHGVEVQRSSLSQSFLLMSSNNAQYPLDRSPALLVRPEKMRKYEVTLMPVVAALRRLIDRQVRGTQQNVEIIGQRRGKKSQRSNGCRKKVHVQMWCFEDGARCWVLKHCRKVVLFHLLPFRMSPALYIDFSPSVIDRVRAYHNRIKQHFWVSRDMCSNQQKTAFYQLPAELHMGNANY